jgi:hypothetical protein
LKENVIMGRLIPAGTGMRFYRNVLVDYDPSVNQKREEEMDEFPIITGGLDLPIDIPLIESGGEDEVDEPMPIDEYAMDTEEVFEMDDSSMELVELDDDDDI